MSGTWKTHRYLWLQQGELIVRIDRSSASLRRSYRIENNVADARASGIGGGVFIQCGMQDPLGEVRYVQRGGDFPIMIVGHADLASPGAPVMLERFAEVPNVRGDRYSIAWDPDPIATFAPAPVELSGTLLCTPLPPWATSTCVWTACFILSRCTHFRPCVSDIRRHRLSSTTPDCRWSSTTPDSNAGV